MTKVFNVAVRRAWIEDFRFHDLRHTLASYLVMAGVDLRTVAQLLGHKTLQMTMRYSHLSQAHLERAVNTLDRTLAAYDGHHMDTRARKAREGGSEPIDLEALGG